MIFSFAAPAPSVGNLYRAIWRFAEGARGTMLASTALLTGSTVVKLAVPWLTAQAINAMLMGTHGGVATAAFWVAAVAAVYAGAWVLHGPGRILERTVGVRVRQRVAAAMYAKLVRAPLAWHERQHSGEVQNRVNQASHALHDFAQTQFVYLQSAVNFVGPVVALALLSTTIGWLACAGYVLVGLVILRFDRSLVRLAVQQNQAERRYAAGLLDFIGNVSTVVSLRLQASTQRLLGDRLDSVFVPLKRAIVLNEAKWCAVDMLSVVLTWSLVCAYVWQSRNRGEALLIGSVFMIYQYAQQAGSVIGSMAANFQGFAKARTDYASADLIWQAPEERDSGAPVEADWQRIDIVDLCHAHGASLHTATGTAGAASATAAPPAGLHVEPQQAVPNLAANDDDAAEAPRGGLRHVSLTLHRGERIALVGPSGSGKSTLMRVLAGLYEPQHGHFEVDGVARLGLRHLGSVSTLIPQEADVFEASVRENLTFGRPCSEADLREAVHTSGFETVLAGMPEGLDTPISERGFNLSGGQRQRLCLARGLHAARGSSLLMLDEPTSALDPVTEARVHHRLDASFESACIVASVHRMSLLEHFDRVVLMVDGRIVDCGTVPEVQQRQPIFREMVRSQAREDGNAPKTPEEAAAAA
ncbi:MAG: ABC transporter ATP-binding protein/permease [Pseudomonadota bacterium]|nr:ABC transporter ATP-binding protein/permease [Pseudomonadota bacterium]